MKAYKVTISGTYRTTGNEVVDFNGVDGIVPFIERELVDSVVVARYAKMWLTLSSKCKARVSATRSTYIDKIEVIDHEFSYIGKDIKELDYVELQDMAVAKDLRSIPLYKAGGLREAHVRAYAAYSLSALDEDIEEKKAGFNFSDLPPLHVDGKITHEEHQDVDPEESIHAAFRGKTDEPAEDKRLPISRHELEKMAEFRKIEFHPNIADAKLYDRIFLTE